MKAILVNDDRSLRWDDVSDPVMKYDEVLVKIEYAALNRADLMQREGDYPPPEGCPDWMDLKSPVKSLIWQTGPKKIPTGKKAIRYVRFSAAEAMPNM